MSSKIPSGVPELIQFLLVLFYLVFFYVVFCVLFVVSLSSLLAMALSVFFYEFECFSGVYRIDKQVVVVLQKKTTVLQSTTQFYKILKPHETMDKIILRYRGHDKNVRKCFVYKTCCKTTF